MRPPHVAKLVQVRQPILDVEQRERAIADGGRIEGGADPRRELEQLEPGEVSPPQLRTSGVASPVDVALDRENVAPPPRVLPSHSWIGHLTKSATISPSSSCRACDPITNGLVSWSAARAEHSRIRAAASPGTSWSDGWQLASRADEVWQATIQ
jgi:hypothetical protein